MTTLMQLNLTRIGASIQIVVIPFVLLGYWRVAIIAACIGAAFGWSLYYYEYKRRLKSRYRGCDYGEDLNPK